MLPPCPCLWRFWIVSLTSVSVTKRVSLQAHHYWRCQSKFNLIVSHRMEAVVPKVCGSEVVIGRTSIKMGTILNAPSINSKSDPSTNSTSQLFLSRLCQLSPLLSENRSLQGGQVEHYFCPIITIELHLRAGKVLISANYTENIVLGLYLTCC